MVKERIFMNDRIRLDDTNKNEKKFLPMMKDFLNELKIFSLEEKN